MNDKYLNYNEPNPYHAFPFDLRGHYCEVLGSDETSKRSSYYILKKDK